MEQLIQQIASGLANGAIYACLALALVMIFVYSPQLGFVVAAVALYAILRLDLFQELRRRSEDVIQARAQENSTFIETMRAIQSVKLFNREDEREGEAEGNVRRRRQQQRQSDGAPDEEEGGPPALAEHELSGNGKADGQVAGERPTYIAGKGENR